MRIILPRQIARSMCFLIFCATLTATAQTPDPREMLRAAKAEFSKEDDMQDLKKASELLENIVKVEPGNAEVHYFLGYAYSRLNAADGRELVNVNLANTLKSSHHFEEVIRLSPKYTGQMLISDPYSKLTGEWGSLAMAYLYEGSNDSALWAFSEGKRRGGFGELFMESCRTALEQCAPNAILCSSGDNFSFPLWYLQYVEQLRPDVSIIDATLLNTLWYPEFLAHHKEVEFGLSQEVLDTLNYCSWTAKKTIAGDFSWTVGPAYEERYLSRGNRLLLALLEQNSFRRTVYFTCGFAPENMLGLEEHLRRMVVIDQVDNDQKGLPSLEEFSEVFRKYAEKAARVNPNSQLELRFVDNIRYCLFERAAAAIRDNRRKEATQLLDLYDEYLTESKIPYGDREVEVYEKLLKDAL